MIVRIDLDNRPGPLASLSEVPPYAVRLVSHSQHHRRVYQKGRDRRRAPMLHLAVQQEHNSSLLAIRTFKITILEERNGSMRWSDHVVAGVYRNGQFEDIGSSHRGYSVLGSSDDRLTQVMGEELEAEPLEALAVGGI